MKHVYPNENWPDSWKYSYPYDLEEVYGEVTHWGYAYAYANRFRETLRLLTEVLAPGATILDLAAAQGNFSLKLAELGYRITWNDLREDLADYVRLKHERGEIVYTPGNAFELNFKEPFDAVLITEIMEHVAHPDEFLGKTAQLVKPGGVIVLTTPNGAYFKNRLPKFSECVDPSIYEDSQFQPNSDGHIFLLYPEEIRSLAFRVGLEVEEIILFTTPLTHGHMKMSLLLKVLPSSLVKIAEKTAQKLPGRLREKIMVQMGARLRKPMVALGSDAV